MNVRSAILNTADLIERHPEKYFYENGLIPERMTQDKPACALAWIGHFMGLRGMHLDVAQKMGLGVFDFYDGVGRDRWGVYKVYRAEDLPEALRAYADQEFPEVGEQK